MAVLTTCLRPARAFGDWQRQSLLMSLVLSFTILEHAIAPSFALPANSITSNIAALKRSNQRWIEIRLSTQRLIAWKGKTMIHAVIVSTGKAETSTPVGSFEVQSKHRVARMQGDDYDIPDVPYTMYYSGGYAIHGAYWHRSFGTPVSHGCVNVAPDHARWLFNWAKIGTPVVVRQ